ncbi:adenylate kinase [Candidatus Saganbacteria bacterium CG08_land_8_20_14_0_20_45_16]|uniref:Adenylate kinase n=1 Tax=Candidatus Saganbacteria bacterium CG08_land_8_20_14_0_20_45_16 TaxID=2014293 RepID=A0A2H0XXH7_UNCSA|nr:MAG: adenylate kinase [Candidatus Saganbacteria bacterium CG08_land_8_20_14_0_20_45_16]
MTVLVFLGPPGSGKGTQAMKLAEKLGIAHISLGDVLREEVRKGSDIGRKAKEFMDAGKLVPDELTIALTRQRLSQPDVKAGIIVDGFPRSLVQAEAFDKMTAELKLKVKVIYFEIDEEQVVERLSGRRSCKACGAIYHVKYNAPIESGKCDKCGGELYQRSDDQEIAIRTRFEVYTNQTKPLIDRYQQAGVLARVQAAGPIEEIFKNLLMHG